MAACACANCGGAGVGAREKVCECVWRAVFRACYEAYGDGGVPGLRLAEYRADFELIARRVLSERERKVFEARFIAGGECWECCRRLHLSLGEFWHAVYRIEAKLGRAYAETAPYGLFPPAHYYGVRYVQ